jgi:hypothetical protein
MSDSDVPPREIFVNVKATPTGSRAILLLLLAIGAVCLAYGPLKGIMASGRSDYYPYIILILLVSDYFFL